MNLYIHLEISSREEDSNLLKSVLAAHAGFDVLISVSNIYNFLFKKNFLKKGVFHTKSLEHGNWKKNFIQIIYSLGNKITLLDEEAGIIKDKKSLEIFLRARFTNDSLSKINKVFCWGNDDYTMLKKLFPKFKDKFVLSGSSRVDMWKQKFKTYWLKNNGIKKEKILVSLNFPIVNGYLTYKTLINNLRTHGYFDRSKKFKDELDQLYEIKKTNFEHFKKMITFLLEKLPDEKFIVRPHPVEKSETWVKLLSNFKNVEVDNRVNFNEQLSESKILIHNSCTTSFQASLANKKVICFNPSNFDNEHGRIANKLGKMVLNENELIKEIRSCNLEKKTKKKLDEKIFKKKIDNMNPNELSSNLIVKNWIEEGKNIKSEKNNFYFLKSLIIFYNLASWSRNILFGKEYKKHKFNKFDQKKIQEKILKIEKILDLKNKSKVIKLASNCILIKNKA
jgi:surface carbohydrate biosynthesis protein